MPTLSRRAFLAASAAAVPALARGIDPIQRPAGPPKMRLSLAAYSYRQYLDLKKPTMTLFEFVDAAADLPLDGVELTSYYFAETTDAYIDRLRAHCDAKKRPVSGVPVRSDFCQRDDAKRKADVEHVKTWARIAAKLGAESVRVFAGNQPKGEELAVTQKRVIAALEECLEVAAKVGVKLAVENHGGVTATPDGLLALVKPITSPALGVNVDTGNFHGADPYKEVAQIAPYGVNVQVKTEVQAAGGKKVEADLPRMVKILTDANYHGWVALEYEAAEEPKVAVPRHVHGLRKLIG